MERKISSQHKPRRFAFLGLELKDSKIWMKWLMVVSKITKLIWMFAMRLAIWASKYASRTLSSTILNLKVFTFKTGPEFIPWLTSKISGFSPSHEFTKPVRSRKIHSGERFQKYAVSVWGCTSFVLTGARFVWKRMRCQECSDSCGRGFKPLWRAVSKRSGFGDRVH